MAFAMKGAGSTIVNSAVATFTFRVFTPGYLVPFSVGHRISIPAHAPEWTEDGDNLLRKFIVRFGKQWSVIASHIPNRSATQIAARWEKCINPALTKGPFTPDEDAAFARFVEAHGTMSWPKIASAVPHRSAKQCRERWFNNLDPAVVKAPWTPDEDLLIFDGYRRYGPKWSIIARGMPGRTDNAIKNRWNASISKRMTVGEAGEQMLGPSKIRKLPRRHRLIARDLDVGVDQPTMRQEHLFDGGIPLSPTPLGEDFF
jgi:hypothetical protein